MELKVLFQSNKYNVRPQFYGQIKQLADFLKTHPDTMVSIEGYTDNTGNKESNLALSKQRAKAISSILTSKFKIEAPRVEAFGYGDTIPIADNNTATGREKNRRVVAEVFSTKQQHVEKWTIYSVDKNAK